MTGAKGRRWPAEAVMQRDSETGASIRRLTGCLAHSQHLYFTNPGYYDGGKKLLFGSHRGGSPNLFGMELESGSMVQLTDLSPPAELPFHQLACLNPAGTEAYFWHGQKLIALDLRTLEERGLYEQEKEWGIGLTNCTADGRFVCVAAVHDPQGVMAGMYNGYAGFREFFQSHPLSRVLAIATDGSGARVVHEDGTWIGHANTSPRLPNILTICHEGPWDLVDQRIWGLDISTGRTWKIRPSGPGELAGHEYWLADGVTIGYHGGIPQGAVFGFADWEGRMFREFVVDARDSWHFHSRDDVLVVGDGSAKDPYLLLWRIREGKAEGPRRLCWHRSSFHTHLSHCHPAVTPDGKSVLYTSDDLGYSNIYLAEIPAFESLPEKGTRGEQLF